MHREVKRWLRECIIASELETIRKSIKKLAIESCITVLDVTMVKCIGSFSKNFALVQNRIGQGLKMFVLGVTGSVELTKDSLHRN